MTVRRIPVSMRVEEFALLEKLTEPNTPERRALERLVQPLPQGKLTEAALTQILMSLGSRVVKAEMDSRDEDILPPAVENGQ